MDRIAERLEYLRAELRAERVSYGELAELQSLAEHIDPGDVELREAAGLPEFELTVTVKIENCYEDGHKSESEVVVEAPVIDLMHPSKIAADVERYGHVAAWRPVMADWWERVVWPHTGDGHGIDHTLGSCYVATIITADDPNLVGATYEWMD